MEDAQEEKEEEEEEEPEYGSWMVEAAGRGQGRSQDRMPEKTQPLNAELMDEAVRRNRRARRPRTQPPKTELKGEAEGRTKKPKDQRTRQNGNQLKHSLEC